MEPPRNGCSEKKEGFNLRTAFRRHLSGDHEQIAMKKIGVTYDVEGTKCQSVFVYWNIALEKTGYQIEEVEDGDEDEDLFS